MSTNKQTVSNYMEGFRKSDHAQILSCLTDDVVWEMPGAFHLEGKKAFDGEIENPAFKGSPTITHVRLVEENNIVVAEGKVEGQFKNGDIMKAVFCDVFHFEGGKIKKLTSYVMQV
jgi:ketosteroid isomerase-like protein